MTVISGQFVLSAEDQYTLDHPVIGYENLATTDNTVATVENTNYPASNLLNPATNLKWVAEADTAFSDIYLTVTLDGFSEVDYVGIAGHNFGTVGAIISIEGTTEFDSNGDPIWDSAYPLSDETILANDRPAIFRFTRDFLFGVRVRIQYPVLGSGDDLIEPEAAVLYVGKLLTLQRKIYVGHSPISLSRAANVSNGRSESGNFLGRIVLGESNYTSVNLANLTPDWVRNYLDPFLEEAVETPFFFAWRPQSYPTEVGFAWMTDDAQVTNSLSNGMMAVDFNLGGIVS